MVELGDLHGGVENDRRIFSPLSGKGASLVTAEKLQLVSESRPSWGPRYLSSALILHIGQSDMSIISAAKHETLFISPVSAQG
jgi:hypothetical protein